MNKHFSQRAENWIRVLKGEYAQSFSTYINPADEDKFIADALKFSSRACARYLTFRIYHYLRHIHQVNLEKFVLVWQKENNGSLWLTNAFIYKAEQETLIIKKSTDIYSLRNLMKNPYKQGIEEKMRQDYHKRAKDIVKLHYQRVKKLCDEYDIDLPSQLNDRLIKTNEIYSTVYSKIMLRVADELKTQSDETACKVMIEGLLDETIEHLFPKLGIIFSGGDADEKPSQSHIRKGSEFLSTRAGEGLSVCTENTLRARDYKVKIKTDKSKPIRSKKLSNTDMNMIEDALKNKGDHGLFSRFNRDFANKLSMGYSEATTRAGVTNYKRFYKGEESNDHSEMNETAANRFNATGNNSSVKYIKALGDESPSIRSEARHFGRGYRTGEISANLAGVPSRSFNLRKQKSTETSKGLSTGVIFKSMRMGHIAAEVLNNQRQARYSLPQLLFK